MYCRIRISETSMSASPVKIATRAALVPPEQQLSAGPEDAVNIQANAARKREAAAAKRKHAAELYVAMMKEADGLEAAADDDDVKADALENEKDAVQTRYAQWLRERERMSMCIPGLCGMSIVS